MGTDERPLLAALRGTPHARVPVWFMRQAGRYLPGYRRVRSQVDFLTLCKTPQLAADVTMEPLDTLGVDAVIIFSDILVPLEAMGLEVQFTDRGPSLPQPIRNRAAIDALGNPDPEEDLGFVMEVIRETRRRVAGRVPVIGFAGAPFTLACYALEGSSGGSFPHALRLLYEDPRGMHVLLGKLADTVAAYLRAQIAAGAEVVQLFDTWAGLLPHDAFEEFALTYAERVLHALDGLGVPRILFAKGAGVHLERILRSGVEGVSIDAMTDIRHARSLAAGRVTLQGNLPPDALFAQVAPLRARTKILLDVFHDTPRYIFNLGHGILPETPVDNVRVVVEEVHRFRLGAGAPATGQA